jgi:hypothetical protein
MSAAAAPAQTKRPAPLSAEALARAQALPPSERFAKMGGYANVPHTILEITSKVSGHVQHILLEAVIHGTFGAVGNPEYAPIRLSELAAKSPYTRQAFRLAAEDAVERGLLARQRQGKSWAFKTVPENWLSVPNYVWNNNPQGTPMPRDAAGRFCLRGHSIHMADLWQGVEVEPTAAEFVERIETAASVEVRLDVAPTGRVSVVVVDSEPAPQGTEKNRSDLSTVRRSFASLLEPIFLKIFGKVPDKHFLDEIVRIADGAPAEMLAKRVREKIARRGIKSAGLILELAVDVNQAWRAMEFDKAPGAAVTAARVGGHVDCPRCQGYGYDYGFYEGCESGADLAGRGEAPPCPACKGTGKLDAIG